MDSGFTMYSDKNKTPFGHFANMLVPAFRPSYCSTKGFRRGATSMREDTTIIIMLQAHHTWRHVTRLLRGITCMQTDAVHMRPIAIDVVWFVCLSVCLCVGRGNLGGHFPANCKV